jgi:glycosyltransferase involved in cell wall biosynthesis
MDVDIALDSRAIVLTEVEAMGGAERSVLALARWLSKKGIPNHIVTYEDRAGLEAHAGSPVSVVQLRPNRDVIHKVRALRRYFAERSARYAPLLSGYQTAVHGTLAGMRGFHCLMHDTPSLFEDQSALNAGGRVYRWVSDTVCGYGLRSGGKTIVTSQYLREECGRVFGVEAEIARMGGLAGQVFQARQVAGQLRLLSVSRVEANKRIDWMLRALAQMESGEVPLSARVDWRFDVAGTGSQLAAMRGLAQALGVGERVRFAGYVSDDELEALYAEAHLFLMPAVQGYGIPAVEALARGVPVLLHCDSGVSDILLDTAWATVIEGGEEGMLPGLERAIEGVLGGIQLGTAPPELPTEDAWAERVAGLCGWL